MNLDFAAAGTPDGLTRRARYFLAVHGVRVDVPDIEQHREQWLAHGVPARQIDRAAYVHSGLDAWGVRGG